MISSSIGAKLNPNCGADMAKKDVSRKELLERWSVIEQEDDDDGFSSTQPIKRRRFRQLKEQWCKFTSSACWNHLSSVATKFSNFELLILGEWMLTNGKTIDLNLV